MNAPATTPVLPSRAARAADPDQLVDWLLSGIEWQTTVFHVGQYCGRWRASTQGRGLASFHAVLRGHCHLHRPGHPAVALGPGDAVFLLRDEAHHLSPSADDAADGRPSAMRATQPVDPDGTALACGFFQFAGALSAWMVSALPQPLVLRANGDDADLRHAAQTFELMRAEADRSACGFSDEPGDAPSPLIERLASLLFFYVLRHAVRHDVGAADHAGLWALVRRPAFSGLLEQMLRSPGADWSVEKMAAAVHMSRAGFFRQFSQACGEPPAQFVLRLRMQLAAQRLQRGDSVTRAAEHVGYQSNAAFTRAFRRMLGEQPGAYQRAMRADGARAAGTH